MIKTLITKGRKIVANLKNLLVTNKYKYMDEEGLSYYNYLNYGYCSGYRPRRITEQIKTLRELFPSLNTASYDKSIASKPLPANAEGRFAIPRYKLVAERYNRAVEKTLELIEKNRNGNFYTWRESFARNVYFDLEYLRQTKRTVRFWKKLGKEQEGYDILIVPAQFGCRHQGRSARRALAIMNSSEFGLDAFAVGIILLTHPQRLNNSDDIGIFCPGDEYSLDAGSRARHVASFCYSDGEGGGVGFGAYCSANFEGFDGSASGFLPAPEHNDGESVADENNARSVRNIKPDTYGT